MLSNSRWPVHIWWLLQNCRHVTSSTSLRVFVLGLSVFYQWAFAVRVCSTRAENMLRQSVSRKLGAQRGLCMERVQGRGDGRWMTFLLNNFPLCTENPLFYGYKEQLWSGQEQDFGNDVLNRQENISIGNQWEYCVQNTDYVTLPASLIRRFDYGNKELKCN